MRGDIRRERKRHGAVRMAGETGTGEGGRIEADNDFYTLISKQEENIGKPKQRQTGCVIQYRPAPRC